MKYREFPYRAILFLSLATHLIHSPTAWTARFAFRGRRVSWSYYISFRIPFQTSWYQSMLLVRSIDTCLMHHRCWPHPGDFIPTRKFVSPCPIIILAAWVSTLQFSRRHFAHEPNPSGTLPGVSLPCVWFLPSHFISVTVNVSVLRLFI